jgi:hypothetical protein
VKHGSIWAALAAVAITVLSVWAVQRPVEPREADWDDVLAEARAGGYRIITTDALAEKYRQDPQALLLVDTRQEWEYRTGHIAGAVVFPMAPTWWARWRRANALEKLLGPDKARPIVFY